MHANIMTVGVLGLRQRGSMRHSFEWVLSVCCRHLGAGVTSLLTDVDRLTTLVAGLSLLALGVYSARESTRVGGKAIDR